MLESKRSKSKRGGSKRKAIQGARGGRENCLETEIKNLFLDQKVEDRPCSMKQQTRKHPLYRRVSGGGL